jgi:hypothetical protein
MRLHRRSTSACLANLSLVLPPRTLVLLELGVARFHQAQKLSKSLGHQPPTLSAASCAWVTTSEGPACLPAAPVCFSKLRGPLR